VIANITSVTAAAQVIAKHAHILIHVPGAPNQEHYSILATYTASERLERHSIGRKRRILEAMIIKSLGYITIRLNRHTKRVKVIQVTAISVTYVKDT
jgi:hypothetical protein